MPYLCSSHRQRLSQQADENRLASWQKWMKQSGVCYQDKAWQRASVYAGCAMELSIIQMSYGDPNIKSKALEQFTLSTVYLVNTLQRTKQTQQAQFILDRATSYLLQNSEPEQQQSHLGTLLDQAKHQRFVRCTSTLPFENDGQALHYVH